MAIVVPDILISDGTVFRSLRGNAVADGNGEFREVVTGCGVSDGRNYYVLGDYSVETVGRVCNRIPEPIVVSNFDYLVFTYLWENTAGRDLDTATVISEPRDLIIGVDRIGNVPVGWSCGSDRVGDVVWNAGDNTGSGTESVLYNVSELRGLDADVVPRIVIESYATWYGQKQTGDIKINIKAYKGGTMDKGSSYNFFNIGGELVFEQTTDYIHVSATKHGPNLSVSDYEYSHTLTLVYDTRSQAISLTPYYSVG